MQQHQRILLTGKHPPYALHVIAEARPEARDNQVRVRMLAAGLGYSDVMALHGGYPLAPKVPFTPGYDLVGVVDQVGRKVMGFSEGQRVAALVPTHGCCGEYVCVAPELLVPLPDGLDPAESVSLVLNYLTAHSMLHRQARLEPGATVLIHAAAGGVGSALLQLGKLLELSMYGTASSGKHQLVRELGGIPIDYRQQDFLDYLNQAVPGGVDAAFDPIGGSNLQRSYRAVKKGGRVVCYGFTGDKLGGLPLMVAGVIQMALLNLWPDGKRVTLCALPGQVKKDNHWYRETLAALIALLAAGKIKPVVGARIPFAEPARAYDLIEKGATVGKVVLVAD